MQNVSVGFDHARENEKELKKEVSIMQKKLEKAKRDNEYHTQHWCEAWIDNDKLKEEEEAD